MLRISLLLIAVTLIAGVTPIAAQLAIAEIPPMFIPLVRFASAGFLLALTAKALGLWRQIDRRHWPLLALLGFLCVPVNQVGYLIGIQKANASHAGIAYALVPVLVFWISVAMRRAQLSWRLALASLLAFAGAALVDVATGTGGQDAGKTSRNMFFGDALLLFAAASWSLFVILSQPLVKELGAVPTLCVVFLLGTLWHIPVAATEWIGFDNRPEWSAITWRGWAGLAYLTLITAYVNYLLWYIVTSRYEVTRSAVVTNAHFLVTVLLEAAMYGHSIGASALVGSVSLMLGILLATRSPAWRQHPGKT